MRESLMHNEQGPRRTERGVPSKKSGYAQDLGSLWLCNRREVYRRTELTTRFLEWTQIPGSLRDAPFIRIRSLKVVLRKAGETINEMLQYSINIDPVYLMASCVHFQYEIPIGVNDGGFS